MLLSVAVSVATHNSFLALTTILVFGVPHGALDVCAAQHLLKPRLRHWWFLAFALPYLSLAGCVLLSWRMAPEATLIAFLGLSIIHFGQEGTSSHTAWPVVILLGAVPLLLPLCFHPKLTVDVLNNIMLLKRFADVPSSLTLSASWWFIGALLWLIFGQTQSEPFFSRKATFLGLVGLFYLLPPLMSFLVYFVFIHGPMHLQTVVKSPLFPQIGSVEAALKASLPLSLATFILFLCLWPLYEGTLIHRYFALTFQLLAALTLPHMLFDMCLSFHARKMLCRRFPFQGEKACPLIES